MSGKKLSLLYINDALLKLVINIVLLLRYDIKFYLYNQWYNWKKIKTYLHNVMVFNLFVNLFLKLI